MSSFCKHSPHADEWRTDLWTFTNGKTTHRELIVTNNRYKLATFSQNEGHDSPFAVPSGEAHANARLFIAAPKLLAALEKLLDRASLGLDQSAASHGLKNCGVLAEARAALALVNEGEDLS
jgi:hypothetical protein